MEVVSMRLQVSLINLAILMGTLLIL